MRSIYKHIGMVSSRKKKIVWVVISATILTVCRNMILLGVQPTCLAREDYYQEIVIVNNTKVGVGVNVIDSSVPSKTAGVGVNVIDSSVPSRKVGVGVNVRVSSVPSTKVDVSSVPSTKVGVGVNVSSVPSRKVGVGVNVSSVPCTKVVAGFNGSSVPETKKIQTELKFDHTEQSTEKPTHGYELAKRLHNKCKSTRYEPQYELFVKVFGKYVSEDVHTCIIWKVGTTFIRRLYMIKNVPAYSGLINPYDINYDMEYPYLDTITNDPSQSRFMFVRNPYKRLLSGYIDKLLAPNPVYWRVIGVPAIRLSRRRPSNLSLKCGHDLTFDEYVKYVIQSVYHPIEGVETDGHFERMTSLCKPCRVKYDFVGRMETFAEDSLELARRLNLSNQTLRLLKDNGEYFAWVDAIKDTVHQPFDETFRLEYRSCISFKDALKRSWSKLQMRGLIGNMPFPVKDVQLSSVTEEQFLEMALKARNKSSKEERKLLQQSHFLQMFSTISEEDIEHLKRIYKEDFELFEYSDQSPNTPKTV